jgi:tRNA uridine 5-carboxymethylaminomethyl modification enzyme
MFTSRAEYRILLRQDNADERLTGKAIELGLASGERKRQFEEKKTVKEKMIQFLERQSIAPESINNFLESKGTNRIRQKVKLKELLLRPEINLRDLIRVSGQETDWETAKENYYFEELLDSVEIEQKYFGYIEREKQLAEKVVRLDHIRIDEKINVDELLSISTEGRFKLNKYKPETIGQAARISGISPSDINVLLLYMGR